MPLLNPLNSSEQLALYTLADALNVPASWIDQLIAFESGWNPQALNKVTGAMGLIQFIPSTALSMGYTSALDLVKKNPDRLSQLTNPVYRYLKALAPFPTQQSLYMAVFYPAARNWPPATAFPSDVQAKNPGIKTVSDYMRKVGVTQIINTAKPFILAGIILAAILLFNSFQKDGASWQDQKGQTEETT